VKSSVPRLAHHLPSDTPRLRRCSASFGHGSPQKPCCCAEAAAIYVSTVFTKLIYPSYTLHIIAIFRSYYSSAFSYLPTRPRHAPSASAIRGVGRCTDSASPTKSRSPFHISNFSSSRIVYFCLKYRRLFRNCADYLTSKVGTRYYSSSIDLGAGRTDIVTENNFMIKNI